MYRIPMTSEGTFRSNWETAANPMAGAPPGRLGGWWVSETPQVPRPGRVEWGAPGRGVVPAVPSLRPTWPPHEGHVLTERTVRWVTDMSPTVSGATSSCRFRERPATLPQLSETSSYRSAFITFTRWCAGRQLQPWPASSQTVSDHLRWRAESCGSQTISQARRAISHTHRTAGLTDPCATSLVMETIEDLTGAREVPRSRSINVRGSSLDAAQLDEIRAVAHKRRRRGAGLECPMTARRRGQVDLALCSVVLEAGLRPGQAAALSWKDLGKDTDGRATLKVKAGSSGACKSVEISERAFEDLMAIKPKRAETDQQIFSIGAQQIRKRVEAAAQAAELEGFGAHSRPRLSAHREATGANPATARVGNGE